MLVVLHDLTLAAAIADTVVVMDHGRSVAAGPPREVLDAARLAEVWGVDAGSSAGHQGAPALHVDWLNSNLQEVP